MKHTVLPITEIKYFDILFFVGVAFWVGAYGLTIFFVGSGFGEEVNPFTNYLLFTPLEVPVMATAHVVLMSLWYYYRKKMLVQAITINKQKKIGQNIERCLYIFICLMSFWFGFIDFIHDWAVFEGFEYVLNM